jgi:hypothetical protein
MTDQELAEKLIEIGKRENTTMFMGKPDRWYENAHWRCIDDHVNGIYIKTDRGSVCQTCGKNVYLTFPEDRTGPLPD